MTSISLAPRAESSTWRKLPKVGGSRWGFIGVIAGVALVVLLGLIIGICCCVRKRRTRKRLGRAAHGSDLSALHPTPSFGRNALGSGRGPKFMPIRENDFDENDAFVATSPRNSMSYAGAYAAPPPVGSNYQHKRGPSAVTDDMSMDDYNNHNYYRGSEGFRSNYAYGGDAAGYAPGHASNEPSYDYGYPTTQHGQFIEPEHGYGGSEAAAAGYPPAPAQAQYAHAAPYESGFAPSMPRGPRMPASVGSPSVGSPYHENRGVGAADGEQQQYYESHDNYAPSHISYAQTEGVPPPYITYEHTGASAPASRPYQQEQPMSPSRKARLPGGAIV